MRPGCLGSRLPAPPDTGPFGPLPGAAVAPPITPVLGPHPGWGIPSRFAPRRGPHLLDAPWLFQGSPLSPAPPQTQNPLSQTNADEG